MMAEAPPDIRAVFDLPPEDAIAYLRSKGYQVTARWSEMLHREHARAFTVAHLARLDLLEAVRRTLDDALARGETFEQWRANIEPTLVREGWWGRAVDPSLTGADRPLVVGPRRLATIYDTNLRTSRAAGQWARIQEAKADRPYLRYSAVLDRRTRPAHRAWHGVILPVDHPWWATHFPPNGWRCRCTVQQFSERDMERRGYSVTPDDELPADDPRRFVAADGRQIDVPAGIDPGFAYNPGQDYWRALAPTIRDVPAELPVIGRADGLPEPPVRTVPATALRPAAEGSPAGIEEAALEAWDRLVARYNGRIEAPVLRDPTGQPIVASHDAWRDAKGRVKIAKRGRERFLDLIARTITDPDEIWHGWDMDDPSRRAANTEPKPARLLRTLLARFDVDGQEQRVFVLVRVGREGWEITSAFAADRETYYQAQRGGVLTYRREGAGDAADPAL